MSSEAMVSPLERRAQARVFGQPIGLAYLTFTETWERFSYYGMTALLALYMTQQLLRPGHVERIAGFAGFRHALEGVFGPLSTAAVASQTYGLYTAFVYFSPVFGGLVADRWLGRKRAVVSGAVLMSAGHIAMAFDQSFLLALVLLIVGCGLLKGNISTQVGRLYADGDEEGRTRGFAIFSMGINVGAVAGPILCGLLAQIYGWHAGFGAAAVLMLLGLATYLTGYRHFGEQAPPAAAAREEVHPLSAQEWRLIGTLGVVTAITVFQSVAYYQNTNIGLVWIDHAVDLNLFGLFHVPVAWFGSIDPLASIVFVPPLFALWRWQGSRGGEPDEIGKIATGAWTTVVANLLLFAGAVSGRRVNVLWPVAYDVLLGIGFLYYWPPLLALVSRVAPKPVKATAMGSVFLSLFMANYIVGWFGAQYEHLGASTFWALNAGVAAVGGVAALLLARPLRRELRTASVAAAAPVGAQG